ncbi:hypothetical protein ATCC90586_009373 [Pythium insidiosum]|nr:hypothetical protein ATCC90586_009373 [Pythium insidiosum]
MSAAASSSSGGEKDEFQVRAELLAPSRFAPRVLELHRTRALVTDVIAQQCWAIVLLHRTRALVTDVIAQQCWAIVLVLATLHRCIGKRDTLPRVGIIGAGHIGSAVAMALLGAQYPAHRISISTRQPDRVLRCDSLVTPAQQKRFQEIHRVYDNVRVSRDADVLILCMPPTQLKSVSMQIKHALSVGDSTTVVLSVLSGTTLDMLQKSCGTRLVMRSAICIRELTRLLAAAESPQALDELRRDAFRLALEGLGSREEELAALMAILVEVFGLGKKRDRLEPARDVPIAVAIGVVAIPHE